MESGKKIVEIGIFNKHTLNILLNNFNKLF